MSMLVAHMNKMKMPDLDGLQMHVERKRDRHSNPDIDVKRSRLNYELTNRDMSQSYFDQVMTEIEEKKTSKRKVRKDAVVVSSWIISSDSNFFDWLSEEETRKFFEAAKEFFAENYGEENIAYANVHLDETTPHMHLGVIPLRDGRLCANKIFDKKELLRIQNELPKYLQEQGFDLERGREGSDSKHLSVADYKKKVAEDEIHALLDKHDIQSEDVIYYQDEFGEVIKGRKIPLEERVDEFAKMLTDRIEDYQKLKETNKKLEKKNNRLVRERTLLISEVEEKKEECEEIDKTLKNTQETLKQAIQTVLDPYGVKLREYEPVYLFDGLSKPIYLGTVQEVSETPTEALAKEIPIDVPDKIIEQVEGKNKEGWKEYFKRIRSSAVEKLKEWQNELKSYVSRKIGRSEISDISWTYFNLGENGEIVDKEVLQEKVLFINPTKQELKKKTGAKRVEKFIGDTLADFDAERKIQDIAEGLGKSTNITTTKSFSSIKGPRR